MGSGSFFLSVPSYLLALLSFITSFFFRLRRGGGSLDKRCDFADSVSEERHDESISRGTEAESENKCEEFNDSIGFADSENEGDNETSELCLKFRFPTYDEFINRKEKDELREFVDSEVLLTFSSCSNKYEFMSQKDFSGFIEEPEAHNINVDVVDSETKSVFLENENTVALDKKLEQSQCEGDDVHNKEMENYDNGACGETKAVFLENENAVALDKNLEQSHCEGDDVHNKEMENYDNGACGETKAVFLENENAVALDKNLEQSHCEGDDVHNKEMENYDNGACGETKAVFLENENAVALDKNLEQSHCEGDDVHNKEMENYDNGACGETKAVFLENENAVELDKNLERSHCEGDDVHNKEMENYDNGACGETKAVFLENENAVALDKNLEQSHCEGDDVHNKEMENYDSGACSETKAVFLENENVVALDKNLEQSHCEGDDVHNKEMENYDNGACGETKAVFLENENTVALDKNLELSHCEGDDARNKEMENSDNGACCEEDTEENQGKRFTWEKGELGKGAENQIQADFDLSYESLFQSEKESFVTDSDSVSIGFEHMHGLMSRLVDYYSDGFLSDQDFGGEFEFGALQGEKVELHHSEMSEEKQDLKAFNQVDTRVVEEHVGKLEQDHLDNLEILASEFLSENDFHEDESEIWNLGDELMNGSQECEDIKSKNEAVLDSEEANKLESLWEHQELIEQLQMELRKVRATGLPTIFEESESSKMEDLKPWKIDERFQRGDCIGELHKLYKSYRERMRKFDILTYQKMYAIGFLQKDPLQLLSSHKSSRPTVKSLLSQNLWLLKHKSHGADPMEKFIKELQSDLEVVYVGQMCLSWEFLNWQYGKALDLWDSDPRGVHQYNEVAGEFQQFQVLMQRFIEDEPFQGTRVQHYIKRRCDARNLLQVPVIREDSIKDRKKGRKYDKGDNAITIEMIVEMLEESIRIFWQFVKADKDSGITTVKGQKGVHPDVQNAEDLEVLMEVMKSLRKKENALKNILRSEHCILRRFRRCRDVDSDHVLYFFSQVDMKLVSRVLNMSRLTTDQLVWCHDKLSRINFVQRKIHVEPSFLLFPC